MTEITTGNAQQYGDSRKLAARARLNSEYTVAEVPWFAWVAQNLSLKPDDRVLDIGCGPGWFWAATSAALPERLDLTLADSSAGMVAEAVERCHGLPFAALTGVTADAVELPFADASFDAVIAMHMLYHLPDPSLAIAEMFRVLRPGGVLAVTTNGAGNMAEIYALTTVFGSAPGDPAAAVFGFDHATRLMHAQFGNVTPLLHPAGMRITDPEDVFLALTSYPPGEGADATQLAAFRSAIAKAFQHGNGVLEVAKETGLFLSRKAG